MRGAGAYPGFLDEGGYTVLESPSQPNAARGSGKRCNLPPSGSGGAPAANDFGEFWTIMKMFGVT